MLRCLAKPNSSSSASLPGLSPHCPALLWKPRKVWWKAVPSSLSSERPDNNPPPPSLSAPGASRTKAAPVEVGPSCFTWITDRFPSPLFYTHMHTHPSSPSSDVELVQYLSGLGPVLAAHSAILMPFHPPQPSPPTPAPLNSMLLIKIGLHQILLGLNNNSETKKKNQVDIGKTAAINWQKLEQSLWFFSTLSVAVSVAS